MHRLLGLPYLFLLLLRLCSITTSAPTSTAASIFEATSSLISTTTPTPATQTQVAQTPTGGNKDFDPFGVIGGNNDGGENEPKPSEAQPSAPEKPPSPSSTASSATTSKQQSDAAKSSTASSPGSTGSHQASTSTSTGAAGTTAVSAASDSPGSTVSQSSATTSTSTYSAKATNNGNDQASGTSSYSWKILGIGVLAFVGVVIIILFSAFWDSVMQAIKRPFKKRDEEDEMLVPDWKHGSWRIGVDNEGCYPEKNPGHFGGDSAIDGGMMEHRDEKTGLAFLPVSPFPKRSRPRSGSHGTPVSPGLSVGATNAQSVRSDAGGYSILPSPPPPAHKFTPARGDGECDPFADPRSGLHSDAYGGME